MSINSRKPITRRQFVQGLGLVVAGGTAGVLAACAQPTPAPKTTVAPTSAPAAKPAGTPPKAQDKEIIVSLSGGIPTMDTHGHSMREGIIALRIINEHFLIRDQTTMRPKPNLISEWKVIDDTNWEFKLRSGMKFHNGDPVTADDAKFSFDRVLNPDYKSPQRANISWIKEVKVTDPLTFRITTDGPFPLVLERLAGFALVPQKYIKDKGDAYFAENPVGTGPYKFVSWERGVKMVAERNENYWGTPGILKRITFRHVPDTATEIAELLAGNLHVVRVVPADQIKAINASQIAEARVKPILRVVFVFFDAFGRAGASPFQKLQVRQAANYAVDKKMIVDKVLSGNGKLIEGPLNPMHFGFDPDLKGYTYDPEKAKKLLAEAGYPNGVEVDITCYMDMDVVEAIQGFWGKVGIKANIKDTRSNVAGTVEMERQGKLKDSSIWNWGSYSVFDADSLFMFWFHKDGQESYASSPELAPILESARKTLDENKRKQLYAQAQKIAVDEAYWLPLYARYTIEGVSRKLVYEPAGDEYQYFESAYWQE
jgi:peptide/nickel transport system substrate-binding protein